jgi:hypothetical protein
LNCAGFHLHALWTQVILQEIQKKSVQEFDFSKASLEGLLANPHLILAQLVVLLYGQSDAVSSRPARLMGLHQKGGIAVGKDADFFLFDPFTVSKARPATGLKDSHLLSHSNLVGKVQATFLRGKVTYRAVPLREQLPHVFSHGEIIFYGKSQK